MGRSQPLDLDSILDRCQKRITIDLHYHKCVKNHQCVKNQAYEQEYIFEIVTHRVRLHNKNLMSRKRIVFLPRRSNRRNLELNFFNLWITLFCWHYPWLSCHFKVGIVQKNLCFFSFLQPWRNYYSPFKHNHSGSGNLWGSKLAILQRKLLLISVNKAFLLEFKTRFDWFWLVANKTKKCTN